MTAFVFSTADWQQARKGGLYSCKLPKRLTFAYPCVGSLLENSFVCEVAYSSLGDKLCRVNMLSII